MCRLVQGTFAFCFVDGLCFTAAFRVVSLPFLVTLIFSAASSSSLELVVKLQLELDGVAAFRFHALFFAAFACLSGSFSCSTAFFKTSMSFPLEIAGERALDTLEALPLLNLMFTGKGCFPGCASSFCNEVTQTGFPSSHSTACISARFMPSPTLPLGVA